LVKPRRVFFITYAGWERIKGPFNITGHFNGELQDRILKNFFNEDFRAAQLRGFFKAFEGPVDI